MDVNLISKLVMASGVSAGELVLVHFWGEDADKYLANNFLYAVTALGATPFLLQQSRSINREIFLQAAPDCFDERYFSMLKGFDAVLDVFTYQPVVLGSDIGEEQLGRYKKYMSGLFSALMNCKRFTQIRIPTAANAEESGLDADDYIFRMTRAYDVDYPLLAAACLAKKEALSKTTAVTLHTGARCELHFALDHRAWHVDAGDGDLPCGEVYIAPLETQTHGTVYFETLYIEDLGKFDRVTLTVENGLLVQCDQEDVSAFLQTLPQSGTVVCELGFGMNPNVKELCGYAVLDEKAAGTFHIAIGANHMFGGQNEAPLHIDLVGTGYIEEV